MKKINFARGWEEIKHEIFENKPKVKGAYPIEITNRRLLLTYAEVWLAKAQEAFESKDVKNFKFHFDLYSIAMKHYYNWEINGQNEN